MPKVVGIVLEIHAKWWGENGAWLKGEKIRKKFEDLRKVEECRRR
jgi:hypothetical protein